VLLDRELREKLARAGLQRISDHFRLRV
jgi:hypothetical protein